MGRRNPICGIASYGSYVPRLSISKDEFVNAWGRFAARCVLEKTVADSDEDSMTMAIEAARACLEAAGSIPSWDGADPVDGSIEFVAVGSSTYPYDGKFHPAMVLEALGLGETIQSMQFSGSTKAGTEALLASIHWALGHAEPASEPPHTGRALVAVGDSPKADVSSDEDHPLGAGAAAFLISTDSEALIAEFEGAAFYAAETMGNWFKPSGSPNLKDIGVPGYSEDLFIKVVSGAVKGLLNRLGRSPNDYAHVVFQQPDAASAKRLARALGFSDSQTARGLTSVNTGDAGAASALLGLAAVLDEAQPGDKVLVASFGAGSGADALSFEVTDGIARFKRPLPVKRALSAARKITYLQYLKLRGRL